MLMGINKVPDKNTVTGELSTQVLTVKEPFQIIGQTGISPTFPPINGPENINWNKNTTYDEKYLGEGNYKQKTITNLNGTTTIKYYFDAIWSKKVNLSRFEI